MSASVSGMRGGQPSTTQPIATPWLSPKVVTRNRWPKVLWDMPCRNARAHGGQTSGRHFGAPEGRTRKSRDFRVRCGAVIGPRSARTRWHRPEMTAKRLTIPVQPAVAEHVDRALRDRQLGGALRCLEAERDHQ